MENLIAKSFKLVVEKVNVALKNSSKSTKCTIVGASKTKPVYILQQAYDAGLRHFGENYVDELVTKSHQLPQDIQWHYIGHLQSNKIKQVLVPNLYMLETIDSIKLANKVQNACEKIPRKIKILVQVKTSAEDTKSGIDHADIPDLINHILMKCPNLEFSGLMTIGYEGDETAFQQLYDLKCQISEKFSIKKEDIELSMGMSQDYEKAISYGSTNVRIGSTIFGNREYPNKQELIKQQDNLKLGEKQQN